MSWFNFWRRPKSKYPAPWIRAEVYYNPDTKNYKVEGNSFIKKRIKIPQSTVSHKEIKELNLPWNPNGSQWKKGDIKKIDTIIVHQAGGPGTIEQINQYHITGPNHLSFEGAPHIAYDFGIRKNGEICKLNKFEDVLWSNKGVNTRGVAIVVIGDFPAKGYHTGKEEPTINQISSLKKLITYLCDENEIKNQLSYQRVFGHDYFGKPHCPGDTLSSVAAEIRNNGSVR